MAVVNLVVLGQGASDVMRLRDAFAPWGFGRMPSSNTNQPPGPDLKRTMSQPRLCRVTRIVRDCFCGITGIIYISRAQSRQINEVVENAERENPSPAGGSANRRRGNREGGA